MFQGYVKVCVAFPNIQGYNINTTVHWKQVCGYLANIFCYVIVQSFFDHFILKWIKEENKSLLQPITLVWLPSPLIVFSVDIAHFKQKVNITVVIRVP